MNTLLNKLRWTVGALVLGIVAQLALVAGFAVVEQVAPNVAAISVAPAAHAGALADYGENKVIDALVRGQALGAPATGYWGVTTDTCTDSGAGTEPSGNGYARVAVTANLTNWSGTLNSSQTVASTGTGGTTYNINAINLPTSTGAWGNLQAVRLYDAATVGNVWICINLTAAVNVTGSGFTLSFPAGSLSFQADN